MCSWSDTASRNGSRTCRRSRSRCFSALDRRQKPSTSSKTTNPDPLWIERKSGAQKPSPSGRSSVSSANSQSATRLRNSSANMASSGGVYMPWSGQVRNEAVAGRDEERLGLALRPPAQLGLQLEVAAEQHGRQEKRQLKTVFLRGREEAHRPVEVQPEAVRPEPLQLADEAVELHAPQQLPVARGGSLRTTTWTRVERSSTAWASATL